MNLRGNPNPNNQFVKGHKKVGGRVKGVNTAAMIAEAKALALKEAPASVAVLVHLRDTCKSPMIRLSAAERLLDRGLGKPNQAHLVEGNIAHSFQVITHAQLFGEDASMTIEGAVLPAISNGEENESSQDER